MREPTALIVDDEGLARKELRGMLDVDDRVRVVAEAEDVAGAAAAVAAHSPDVVFLDIQLVGETGFDLLPRLPSDLPVVFVTAYDEYAVRAFEVNALDYLLKPVREARLAHAIDRLLEDGPAGVDPEPAAPPLAYEDHLFLRLNDRRAFVKVSTIECITAAGNYSRVHTADGTNALVHKTLKEWEARLPRPAFLRIHRSAIVNLEFVDRVEEWGGSRYLVHVRGLAQPLAMSRRYAARIQERLG